MARLTMAQAYAYARQAGFDPAAATIAAAIAMAESGLRTDARGDVGLQTDYWGPSVGLMQIRTVKSKTGTGDDRDISRLDDPLQNMISAYKISSGGKNWAPWTTYTRGTYRQFLGQAQQGAQQTGPVIPGATITPVGLDDAISLDGVGAGIRRIGITLLAVMAGGALAVAGAYRLVGSPGLPGPIGKVLS